MRSIKKTKKITNNSDKISFTGSQVVEVVNTIAEVTKSRFDLFSEMERTKQVAIDAQVKIRESDNNLALKLAEFEKDMLKIQKDYELESKKIDNKYNFKMKLLDFFEKMIDKIDKLEVTINIYQEKEGMTSSTVITLFEQLHQEKIKYINVLSNLGQN
jgi:hypothetical protein